MLPTANSNIGSLQPDFRGQDVMFDNNNYLPGICAGLARVDSVPEIQMSDDLQNEAENIPHGMVPVTNLSDDAAMSQNNTNCSIDDSDQITSIVTDHGDSASGIINVNGFSGHPTLYNNSYPPFVTFNNQSACNNNNGMMNFTFTTPTQSSLYSPALTSMPPIRYQQHSGPSAHTFSPTVCAPMKHSAPVRIPWGAASLDMAVSSRGVSLFTTPVPAAMEPSYCISPRITSYSSPMCSKSRRQDPTPCCSRTPRRPKRPSSENIDLLSPTNKVHLTEEKIAAHMQELHISALSPPLLTGSLSPLHNGSQLPIHTGSQLPVQTGSQLPLQTGTMSDSPPDIVTGTVYRNSQLPDIVDHLSLMKGADKGFRSLTQDQQWQTFKDLEERLDISDDDTPESERDCNKSSNSEPKLHFVSDIERLPGNDSVIPPEILKELNKPRLEVVLWTPPGDLVKNTIGITQDATQQPVKPRSKQSTDLVKTQRLLSSIQEDGYMDTEMMEDSLEL